jgi:hypothetical protein
MGGEGICALYISFVFLHTEQTGQHDNDFTAFVFDCREAHGVEQPQYTGHNGNWHVGRIPAGVLHIGLEVSAASTQAM